VDRDVVARALLVDAVWPAAIDNRAPSILRQMVNKWPLPCVKADVFRPYPLVRKAATIMKVFQDVADCWAGQTVTSQGVRIQLPGNKL